MIGQRPQLDGSTEVLVSTQQDGDEQRDDAALRPRDLDGFIGQEPTKRNLEILIRAAQERKQPLEHIIFSGPPGLGKTSLAHLIARSTGAQLKVTSGPVLERAGDLASILTSLQVGDCLFIDEIHRLNRTIEEVLYPAMEDYALDLVLGKGPAAKTMRLELPHFTLIGATTQLGRLSAPLRDRFGAHFHLDFYEVDEIKAILLHSAAKLQVPLSSDGAEEIARRSRRTPRIANRLLRRVRDYAQVHRSQLVTGEVASQALDLMSIDERGLNQIDRQLLAAILHKFNGGPVGLGTLAAALGEDETTIEEMHEPYLIREGWLERTSRGRQATAAAVALLPVVASTS